MVFDHLFFDVVLRSEVVVVFWVNGRLVDFCLECVVEVELLVTGSFLRRLVVHLNLEQRLVRSLPLVLHPDVVVQTRDQHLLVVVVVVVVIVHIVLGTAHFDPFRLVNLSRDANVDHARVDADGLTILLAHQVVATQVGKQECVWEGLRLECFHLIDSLALGLSWYQRGQLARQVTVVGRVPGSLGCILPIALAQDLLLDVGEQLHLELVVKFDLAPSRLVLDVDLQVAVAIFAHPLGDLFRAEHLLLQVLENLRLLGVNSVICYGILVLILLMLRLPYQSVGIVRQKRFQRRPV